MKSVAKLMLGLALATAGVAPAYAKETAAKAQPVSLEVAAAGLEPGKFVWADTDSAEPVTVVVSIPMQQAYVFRGQALVATSAVSTGKAGDDTPTGIFPVLQKAVKHTSNLYGSSMPYMQRLTWDGIALHAGPNPGFPASHGCVRLPNAFAKKLFEVTDLGTTVVVTDQVLAGTTLDPELLRTDTMRANEEQMAALAGN